MTKKYMNCETEKIETATNVLCIECPVHAIERYNLEQTIGSKMTVENISIIMIINERYRFLNYCKYVGNKVIDRNKTGT